METIVSGETEESLRLANLGYFVVVSRMKTTGLQLNAAVTSVAFTEDRLVIETAEATYSVQPESVEFTSTRIKVWIREGRARKCSVVLGAIIDDRFVAEVNPARLRAGLPPILTPEQQQQEAERRHQQYLTGLAQPLADKAVGRTIAEVRVLDTTVSEYEIIFTDGTSLTISADLKDYDVPVILVDGQAPCT